MRFDPQAGQTPESPTDENGRRHSGRLPQEGLMSNLGPVLDLSSSGMRVEARRTPEREVEVCLYNDGEGVRVKGEIIWSKRSGLLKRELGVRFVDVTPEVSAVLTRIAAANRFRRAM
ncbi:MAG: PilZ domain-containing protein [Planctomycetota bacterium]